MKKIIAGTLLFMIVFTATACHKDTPEMTEVQSTETVTTLETTEETTVATTVAPTVEATIKATTAAKKTTAKKATKKSTTTQKTTTRRTVTCVETVNPPFPSNPNKTKEIKTNYWQKNNPGN